jgi:hypothetical protein
MAMLNLPSLFSLDGNFIFVGHFPLIFLYDGLQSVRESVPGAE